MGEWFKPVVLKTSVRKRTKSSNLFPSANNKIMDKKAITLPKFVETFPKEKCFYREVYIKPYGIDYDYDKNLSYEDKLRYEGYVYKNTERLSATDNCIYYVRQRVSLKRNGRTFYPLVTDKGTIYISKKEISFGGNIGSEFVLGFLIHLGINWFKDIPISIVRSFLKNKVVFRRILTGRIYNEETFYKTIGAYVFRIKNVSWRHIRKHCVYSHKFRLYWFPLDDIVTFTKNPEKSIDVICNTDDTLKPKLYDLLNSAIKLNEVVDFSWSPKRIEEEHKRQTLELMSREISSKKNDPIYDVDKTEFLPFILLNTEKAIFVEGSLMHHCLYTNYYSKIKNHNYIAFHLNYPEDCTLGIWMCNDKPVLNQIYKKYDERVTYETRQYAEDFIRSHEKNLIRLFNQRVKEDKRIASIIQELPLPDPIF